jgi:hypothetical protein
MLGLFVVREPFLFVFELGSVNNKASGLYTRLVFHVKHLVEHHVFRHVGRDVRRIEQAAYEDRVMRAIEPAEDISRLLGRPRDVRLAKRV